MRRLVTAAVGIPVTAVCILLCGCSPATDTSPPATTPGVSPQPQTELTIERFSAVEDSPTPRAEPSPDVWTLTCGPAGGTTPTLQQPAPPSTAPAPTCSNRFPLTSPASSSTGARKPPPCEDASTTRTSTPSSPAPTAAKSPDGSNSPRSSTRSRRKRTRPRHCRGRLWAGRDLNPHILSDTRT